MPISTARALMAVPVMRDGTMGASLRADLSELRVHGGLLGSVSRVIGGGRVIRWCGGVQRHVGLVNTSRCDGLIALRNILYTIVLWKI
jgi:hypothetical protein